MKRYLNQQPPAENQGMKAEAAAKQIEADVRAWDAIGELPLGEAANIHAGRGS